MVDADNLKFKLNEMDVPSDSKFGAPEVGNAVEMLLNHNSSMSWVSEFEAKFPLRTVFTL